MNLLFNSVAQRILPFVDKVLHIAAGENRMLSTLGDHTREKLHDSVFDFDVTFTGREFTLKDGLLSNICDILSVFVRVLSEERMSVSTSSMTPELESLLVLLTPLWLVSIFDIAATFSLFHFFPPHQPLYYLHEGYFFVSNQCLFFLLISALLPDPLIESTANLMDSIKVHSSSSPNLFCTSCISFSELLGYIFGFFDVYI